MNVVAANKDVAQVYFEKIKLLQTLSCYLKTLNKVTSCNYRIEFLKQCLNNDIIPDFLRFRAP